MDTKTYCKLRSNPTTQYKQILQNIVREGLKMGFITQKQVGFIITEYPITEIFHSFFLPPSVLLLHA